FNDTHPRLTPSTAGWRTGITRTAARRYLRTLNHLGYVESNGRLFWLTPRVLRLGWSYCDSAKVPRAVQPFLQQISAELDGARDTHCWSSSWSERSAELPCRSAPATRASSARSASAWRWSRRPPTMRSAAHCPSFRRPSTRCERCSRHASASRARPKLGAYRTILGD